MSIKFEELDEFLKPEWTHAGIRRLHNKLSAKYHCMLGQYDIEAPDNFKYYRAVLCDALSMLALSESGAVSAKDIADVGLPVSELAEPGTAQLGYARVIGDAKSAYGKLLKRWEPILRDSGFHTNAYITENKEGPGGIRKSVFGKSADDFERVDKHHEPSFHHAKVYSRSKSDEMVILVLSDSVEESFITDAQRAKMLEEIADTLFSLHFIGLQTECVGRSIQHSSKSTLSDLWYCALESANKRKVSICAVCGHPALTQPRGKPRKYCQPCRKWLSHEKKAETGKTRRERLF